MLNTKNNFWKDVYSENGIPSSKRIAGHAIIAICMMILVYLTIVEGGSQIVENLWQTAFITGGALLGITSVTNIWKDGQKQYESQASPDKKQDTDTKESE